ncbi:MAG: ABC transporter permease [Clostridia bacterium]|nr:ABC transporter permease [Clostridia bacterium]
MRESLVRILTLTGRNIKEILRDPLSFLFMLALPLGMEILFYFVFHKLTPQFEMKYLAPGIVVFSQAFLSLFAGLLLALDKATAFLTRLFVSQTKPHEFIFGYALSLLPITLAQSVLFFVIGGLIDPSLFGLGMIWAIPLSLVTSLLFIGLGILIGSLCNEKSVGGVASVIIMCQSVLSGMWFPLEGMGKEIVTFMKYLPFKNATDLIRNIVNGIGDPPLWKPLIVVLLYTAAALIAAILAFRSKMRAK